MSADLSKIFIGSVFTTVLFGITGFAQTDAKRFDELQRLNKQTVAQYQAHKFDDALITANQSLELAISLFGDNSLETALSYEYLGEIYLSTQKSGLAVINFQTAWSIHKEHSFKNINRASRVLTQLAPAMIADKKEAQLKDTLLAIVGTADAGDQTSSKLLPFALRGLTKLYTHTGQFKLADETFVRRYSFFTSLTDKNFSEFLNLYEEHGCYKSLTWGSRDSREFKSELRKQTGDDLKFGGVLYVTRKSDSMEGKALKLPKPEYTQAALASGAGGIVAVKVLIDERGHVLAATALCGHPLLRPSAEAAAKGAKFSPATIAGEMTRASGIVTYNFVR